MIPLHRDRHFTVRFGESRIITRFHLDSVATGGAAAHHRDGR